MKRNLGAVAYLALAVAALPGGALAQEGTAITIVGWAEPDTLDPCENAHAAMSLISKNNIMESLLDRDPQTGGLSPRLALSWELISDNTWRVTLREGVVFSDGTPFNADAVVWSIARGQRQDEFVCAVTNKAFTNVIKLTATAVSEYTVDIIADRPAPILDLGLAFYPMMSPSSERDALTRDPVGTGPYLLKEWTSGVSIVLERNPDYWGEQPEISQATYVFRNEPAVRAAMVATGEADIALEITAQDATNPATDFAYVNTETTWLRIDDRFDLLADQRIREAMALAIDREAMLGSILPEDTLLAAQLPLPAINGHDPDIPQREYNPDRARELIAEAKADGLDVGASIRFPGRIGVFANAEEVMEVITQMLNEVGFNVSLEMMERARHANYQARPFPEDVGPNINLLMSDNDRGDASFSVINFHSNGNNQSATFTHPELDAMIDAALVQTGEARTAALQEVLAYVQEKAISIPLFYMVSYARVSERLDWKPSSETATQIVIQNITLK